MRTYLITPSFCKAKLLEQCMAWIYQEKNPLPAGTVHVVIDNHYPINKEENQEKLRFIARWYDCVYVDSGKDLGLHEGLNNAVQKLNIGPDDLVMGNDPDDRAQHGAFHAMREVMKTDPKLAVLGCMFPVIQMRRNEGIAFREETIAGHSVLIHPHVEMWNVAAFNMGLIYLMGGFKQTYAYYGGLEAAMYGHWVARSMKMGYLRDFTSEAGPVNRADATIFDPELRMWKDDHVGHKFPGSFEEWLRATGREQRITGKA